jgi:hypothetical protein
MIQVKNYKILTASAFAGAISLGLFFSNGIHQQLHRRTARKALTTAIN